MCSLVLAPHPVCRPRSGPCPHHPAGLPTAVFAPWVDKLVREHERQAAVAAAVSAEPGDVTPLPPPPVVTLDAELEPLLLSKAAQVCSGACGCDET